MMKNSKIITMISNSLIIHNYYSGRSHDSDNHDDGIDFGAPSKASNEYSVNSRVSFIEYYNDF